jgi:hypothetical protein
MGAERVLLLLLLHVARMAAPRLVVDSCSWAGRASADRARAADPSPLTLGQALALSQALTTTATAIVTATVTVGRPRRFPLQPVAQVAARLHLACARTAVASASARRLRSS